MLSSGKTRRSAYSRAAWFARSSVSFMFVCGQPTVAIGVQAPTRMKPCGWIERNLIIDISVQIGRASCRERVCQYVYMTGVAEEFKKTKQEYNASAMSKKHN